MSIKAFLLAVAAIVLWSFLAAFGARFDHVPPLLVLGITFCISGVISGLLAARQRWRAWRIPLKTLAVGVGGIFGYHFLYFSAFQRAPAVEVNLINYLWPLLIVMLSPLFLPGYRLGLGHVIGAMMGLAGAFLIIGGGRLGLDPAYLGGYLLAASDALVWAVYSLLTKRLPPFSSEAVGAFCLASGLLALGAYAAGGAPFPLATLSAGDWVALLFAGVGPMGLAFFAWDAALKRGDPRVIGALSYLTPLLSTLNLALFTGSRLTSTTAVAMALIVGGAAIGTLRIETQSRQDAKKFL
jgi:drug/metabolite transporter (DMT)-like permease